MAGAVLVGGFVAEANGEKGKLVLRVEVDFDTFDIAPGAGCCRNRLYRPDCCENARKVR